MSWKSTFGILSVVFIFFCSSVQGKSRGFDKNELDALDAKWSNFLANHIAESGLVDYSQANQSIDDLKRYIEGFRTLKIEYASNNVKTAAYINLYNATMIYHLLNYAKNHGLELTSDQFLSLQIDDLPHVSDIFDGPKIEVSGIPLSLNDIEHKLLRKEVLPSSLQSLAVSNPNPLVHMALNCGAISCPALIKTAVTEKNLTRTLQEAAEAFLSNENHVHMLNKNQMQLNKILLWYYSDFDSYAQKSLGLKGAGDYLAKFISAKARSVEEKKQHLKQHFNDRSSVYLHNPFNSQFKFLYNWRINDIRNQVKLRSSTKSQNTKQTDLQKNLEKNIKKLTQQWQLILDKHLSPERLVNYKSLYKDISQLDKFISAHQRLPLSSASDQQKLAVLINFYNATMMRSLFSYIEDVDIKVDSKEFLKLQINELKGIDDIWEQYRYSLNGVSLTLNNIEHQLIRRQSVGDAEIDKIYSSMQVSYLDPRIHAAVNCAALSCPRIAKKAFSPAEIDAQLESAMRSFVNSEYQFKKKNNKTLTANKIVQWYYQDFDSIPQTWSDSDFRGAGDYLAKFFDNSGKDKKWKTNHFRKNFNSRSQVYIYDPLFQVDFDFFYNWTVNDSRNLKTRAH